MRPDSDVPDEAMRAVAREEFLLEVARLPAPRGLGPYVGRHIPSPFDGLTQEEKTELILRRPRDV